ncbi:MAG: YceH family protein [Pseudomonadota bacterium]
MQISTLPLLTLPETRVLGVLAEKQRTVPDTYPLTLNSLLAGCNQKTSRDPVMEMTEPEVQTALDTLRKLSLVIETSGGRATRYGHNIERVLHLPSQSVAVLVTLMLRGPQTAGELRLNCDRLHKFSDISSVESFLVELSERPAGSLVMELPRQHGARENRWTHLLSGVPAVDISATVRAAPAAGGGAGSDEIAELRSDVARLEAELGELRALVHRLCTAGNKN